MIPAYYIYRRYKKNQETNLRMDREKARRSSSDVTDAAEVTHTNSRLNDSKFCSRETFSLCGVAAKKLYEDRIIGEDVFVNGKLSLVEKPQGVMIEWTPTEEDGWVLTNLEEDDDMCMRSSENIELIEMRREATSRMKFSVDINDLRSFQCVENNKGHGYAWIRLISKDGSAYPPLYFRQGKLCDFVENLQHYSTLKRSAREANLVLFTDERMAALEQSVSMLNLNNDFFSRFMSQPYAAAITGLGKVANFVQDQTLPILTSFLDFDAITAEEQIKAMRELRQHEEEEAGNLRLHDDCGFELVTQMELPQRPEFNRESPVTEEVWSRHKLPDGSFTDVHSLKVLIFRGGLMPSLRREAWKYLLGALDWNKSVSENNEMRKRRANDYYRMKSQWQSFDADQESRFTEFSTRKALIEISYTRKFTEKDVSRTDRTYSFFEGKNNDKLTILFDVLMTYCMYNFDLGYVQGMSDFLSPLLYIVQDEVDVFWSFVGLMQRVHRNFEMSQTAIKKQLMDLRDLLMVVNPKLANYLVIESHQSDDMYFCFRWMLVAFKREFSFDNILKLWEVLWTDIPCPNFHLLVCVAILDKQTNFIIENQFGLTEILKHVNDLSMNIDLDCTLTTAEAIFHQLSASQDKLPRHISKILSLSDYDIDE